MKTLPVHRWNPALPTSAAITASSTTGKPWIGILDRQEDVAREILNYRYSRVLTDLEQEEFAKYRHCASRELRVLARYAVRSIGANFYNRHPQTLSIIATSHGKPVFDLEGHQQRLHFNVSHSGDFVLLGFSTQHPVGVDIEQIRPLAEWRQIGQRFFTNSTMQRLSALSGSDQVHAFIQEWCHTESHWKSLGTGLQTIDHGAPVDSMLTAQVSHWQLNVPAGYCGAAAMATREDAPAPPKEP